MTAMDLELGVFTRRQVDDHMFVLKEIETRRSQIKFLDFCDVQVLGPLRQKIKELEENVETSNVTARRLGFLIQKINLIIASKSGWSFKI